MVLLLLLGLLVGLFVLIKTTDHLIKLIATLGWRLKIPVFVLSSIFLALATSMPEFFVGLAASIDHQTSISLGTILGSNIADLSLIIGLATVISGSVWAGDRFLTKDLHVVAAYALLPYLLIVDLSLSTIDGLALIAVYIFYNVFLVRGEHSRVNEYPIYHGKTFRNLIFEFILWLVVLGVSAQLVVKTASGLAEVFNISGLFVGLILVALGTSLPELVVEIRSASQKKPGVFFGNILGSVVINASLILGILAILGGLVIKSYNELLPSLITQLSILICLTVFIHTKKRLARWEGGILIVIYVLFLLLERFGV